MMPKSTAPTESRFGALTRHHQQDDGKEQRKRNVHSDGDCAAQVSQENPLDQEHEHASEDQIVQNGVGRNSDERAAIIKQEQS